MNPSETPSSPSPERGSPLDPHEFLKDAQPSRIAQEARQLLDDTGIIDIDPEALRRGQDWSALCDRVVGAEGVLSHK